MTDLNPRGVQRPQQKNLLVEERARYYLDWEALFTWGGALVYCAVMWWLAWQAVSWVGTQLMNAF